jgi:hypothetical protein
VQQSRSVSYAAHHFAKYNYNEQVKEDYNYSYIILTKSKPILSANDTHFNNGIPHLLLVQ